MTAGIKVRRVELEDAKLLWEWANDPIVRQFSFTKDPIEYDSHLVWLKAKLRSSKTCFWIIENVGQPVAQVRFDLVDRAAAEVSFSVAAESRGQGIGTYALMETEGLTADILGVHRLLALVLMNNPVSQRVFDKCGYKLIEQCELQGIPCLSYAKDLRAVERSRL